MEEEGTTTRSLLLGEEMADINGSGDVGNSSSTTTAVLLLGTFVAVSGLFASGCAMMICGGVSFMFFIGNIFTWRTLAIFGMIPCLVQFLGLFFIPESPRWLAKIGREKELEDTIRRLRGKNVDIYAEVAMIKEYTKTFQQLSTANILTLFERRYAHPLIVVQLVLGRQHWQSFRFSNPIPFTALCVFLMDKSGRRPLLMVCAAGTCLGNFLVGLAFLLKDLHHSMELSAALVLSGILVYSASFSLGVNGTPWVLMAEIFPINVRGSAGSLVTFASWFSSWIVSYSFNFLFEWSSTGIFFMFATICGSLVLFVAKLVPETKGRSLEEIQASMTHLLQ